MWLCHIGPVGISWENNLGLITDQAYFPACVILRKRTDHHFSHPVIAERVRVRVRTEVGGFSQNCSALIRISCQDQAVDGGVNFSAKEQNKNIHLTGFIQCQLKAGLALIMQGMV